MPTLAATAETKLRLVISSASLIDWSNQRDADAAEDTARTTAVVDGAAAYVKSILGDTVDGDDATAVWLTVKYATLLYSQFYPVTLLEAGQLWIGDVRTEIKDEAERRRNAIIGLDLNTPDMVDLDLRYPQEIWDDS